MAGIRSLACLLAAVAVLFIGCGRSASPAAGRAGSDWLIDPSPYRAEVRLEADGSRVVLENGLVRREIVLRPDAATVSLLNLKTDEEFVRAVRPEARLTIDGRTYNVGGLQGQPDQAYLRREWLPGLTADQGAFHYAGQANGRIAERLSWARKRYAAPSTWPPAGISLRLDFEPPAEGPRGVRVSLLYELYDGLPLVSKSLVVRNSGTSPVTLETFASEILAFVEPESSVNTPPVWARPNFHVESEMAFLADTPETAAKTVFWLPDPSYTSQVNYQLQTTCLLESRPPLGPDAVIAPGAAFESFRTYLLVHDGADRERRGLALRRMYRTLAPWATENPVMMHLRSADPTVVKAAVDQCATTGFEMLILSFGSGLDMENEDPAYRRTFKELADYAHSRGVEIGGYSLLASRRVGEADDVINPRTGRPGGFAAFGNSPCLGSRWGQDYFRKIKGFFEETGFDLLEHDGSYPGDVCASTRHPGHRGLADSQWTQWRTITEFYAWCRARGIYLNVPDWYFLAGSNKSAMGYREVNWSLPRDRQVVLGRQNIFDGTWEKTPSMGWMFVPLVQYHGGGDAATIEPLDEHLEFYEAHLAQNFSSGVQACYRGVRLYDTERTRAVVKKWVDFYKSYRDILDSDIIHVRRADGRDLDGILHVNPGLPIKGLAVVHNPTDREIARSWTLPLYYTGLVGRVLIREQEGPPSVVDLDRSGRAEIPVKLAPRSMTWFVITAADR